MAAYIYIYILFDLPRAVEVIIEGNQIFPAAFPTPKIKKTHTIINSIASFLEGVKKWGYFFSQWGHWRRCWWRNILP